MLGSIVIDFIKSPYSIDNIGYLIFSLIWFFLFTLMYSIPTVIGSVLSSINMVKKSYILLIIIFIVNIISLIANVHFAYVFHEIFKEGLFFWISIISHIAICIIILIKLIFFKKNSTN